jgi:hypothetical protein
MSQRKSRKSRKSSGKFFINAPNRNFIVSNSPTRHLEKIKFIKFLRDNSRDNSTIRSMIDKLKTHLIKVNKSTNKFIFVDNGDHKDKKYIEDQWYCKAHKDYYDLARNVYLSVGGDTQTYVLKPSSDFYMLVFDDTFSHKEFNIIHEWYYTEILNLKKIDVEERSYPDAFKNVCLFKGLDIGGVEVKLKKFDYFANIYICDTISMKVVRTTNIQDRVLKDFKNASSSKKISFFGQPHLHATDIQKVLSDEKVLEKYIRQGFKDKFYKYSKLF